MKPQLRLTTSLIALTIASCAPQKNDDYDATSASDSAAAASSDVNPVYDTPAAYEETSTTTPTTNSPAAETSIAPSPAPRQSTPAASPHATQGSGVTHVVVKGDTLSGISAKYKVPSAAIKQANGMTKDTVVLGKKMIIPSAR